MKIATPNHAKRGDIIDAINWNNVEDSKDLEVWNRLTGNFWLPEKIALANDIPSWNAMTDEEQKLVMHVFAGLTMLDTLQGTVGATSLLPDATTQIEESVLCNIAFMEAFAAGTELLTPTGWKKIEEVTEGDLVAQYDPDVNAVSFARPKLVPPHWSDEVYEISSENGNARQVVSGGHRVYYEEKVKKNSQCKDWVPATAEARDLKNINLSSAHRRFRCAAPSVLSGVGMSAVDKLLVAINADGTFGEERYTGEKVGTIPVRMTLAKDRKIQRMTELAQDAGWRFRQIGRVEEGGKRHFILDVPLAYVQEGRKKELFGWWDLSAITWQWAQDFVKEIGLWDGHTGKDGHGVTSYTTRKRDNDFIVAVAGLAGYRARTQIRVDNRSEAFADSYVTYIPFNKDCVSAQAIRVKQVEPQMVYCVQVPTTFLVTRNGASQVISGNCVHAKSYSNIFMTLASTPQIEEAFRWARENEELQLKASTILDLYDDEYGCPWNPGEKKIASTILESFLFYSGFYAPLYFAAHSKLGNTADIIRLIIRDEAVHGYYIGMKFQQYERTLPEQAREYLKEFAFELMYDLYENECQYTEDLYDPLGLTEDVKRFLRYNGNKALNNLGYEGLWPASETKVSQSILAALDPGGNENHDFFSGSGSSYVMGTAEDTEDGDWDF